MLKSAPYQALTGCFLQTYSADAENRVFLQLYMVLLAAVEILRRSLWGDVKVSRAVGCDSD
ncbi:hypothetical protein [Mesorhizobium sp. LSJC285A00]|uniref:hypothetical protein n=1 Tax=Mesorhizobium sp. LSJC285A00 TaxID=1287338 RepID=UPI0012EB22A9|nr:hypothetical protein [Mesorhizobium sp. LSJC285A00]